MQVLLLPPFLPETDSIHTLSSVRGNFNINIHTFTRRKREREREIERERERERGFRFSMGGFSGFPQTHGHANTSYQCFVLGETGIVLAWVWHDTAYRYPTQSNPNFQGDRVSMGGVRLFIHKTPR